MTCIIRPAKEEDFAAIQAIYAYYVKHTVVSFEEEVPSVEELRSRWQSRSELPYLVVEQEGYVIGYAYVSYYNTRSAYRYSVENSVYLDKSHTGKGIGKQLMEALINACKECSLKQMVARIVKQESDASLKLHRALGFRECGSLTNIGLKFGQWYDTVIMQLDLTK